MSTWAWLLLAVWIAASLPLGALIGKVIRLRDLHP